MRGAVVGDRGLCRSKGIYIIFSMPPNFSPPQTGGTAVLASWGGGLVCNMPLIFIWDIFNYIFQLWVVIDCHSESGSQAKKFGNHCLLWFKWVLPLWREIVSRKHLWTTEHVWGDKGRLQQAIVWVLLFYLEWYHLDWFDLWRAVQKSWLHYWLVAGSTRQSHLCSPFICDASTSCSSPATHLYGSLGAVLRCCNNLYNNVINIVRRTA